MPKRGLLVAFLFMFLGISNALEISSCQTLSIVGEYLLIQDVSSAGTCFNIEANNITLDCNGHYINYSTTEPGHGINSTANFTTIRNCVIRQISSLSDSHGIYYYNVHNGTIINNTITTLGNYSFGIAMRDNIENTLVLNNTIVTHGFAAHAFIDTDSRNTTFSNNDVKGYGERVIGISLWNSSNPLVSKCSVFVNNTGSYGVMSWGNVNDARILSSRINSSLAEDLFLYNSSRNIISLNTSYEDEYVGPESYLERSWYLDIYVEDASGNPLSQVNVTAWDVFNNSVFSENTSADGLIQRQELLEYNKTNTTQVYFTNYTIEARKPGYGNLSVQVDLDESKQIILTYTKRGTDIFMGLVNMVFPPLPIHYNESAVGKIKVNLSIKPSSPVNVTVSNFTTSYKRWNESSFIAIVNHTIGDLPVNAEILIKKNGTNWKTLLSNSIGYVNFTYNEDFPVMFEAIVTEPRINWTRPRDDNLSILGGWFQQSILVQGANLQWLNCSIYNSTSQEIWNSSWNLTGEISFNLNNFINISEWKHGLYIENCTLQYSE